MMRPLVKLTSSRIWAISSQPAFFTAGVMNLVQMSRSLRSFLFTGPLSLDTEESTTLHGPTQGVSERYKVRVSTVAPRRCQRRTLRGRLQGRLRAGYGAGPEAERCSLRGKLYVGRFGLGGRFGGDGLGGRMRLGLPALTSFSSTMDALTGALRASFSPRARAISVGSVGCDRSDDPGVNRRNGGIFR